MIIYWLFFLYLIAINFVASYKSYISKMVFYFTIFFIFLFVGFRYKVGADWYNYLYFYESSKYYSLNSIFSGGDPAYNFLNYISHFLNYPDNIFVNAFCSFLVLVFLAKTALKLEKYWLVLLIYFPYHILVVSMNYSRQAVAISISLWAFCKLLENRFIQYAFLILLASLFHKTAICLLLFLPLILFIKFQIYKNLSVLYIGLSLIFLCILIYYFSAQETNIYLQGNEEISSKGFFIRWTFHLIPLFLFYKFYHFFKKQIYYPVIQYFCILIFFILPLGMFFSTMADRFNLYMIFFDLFVVCNIFGYLSRVAKIYLLSILIIFYLLQMYLWFFQGDWAIKSWIPYQNYISNYLLDKVFL